MKHFQLFQPVRSSERYFLFTDGSTREASSPPVIGLGAELRNKKGELVFTYSEEILISDLPDNISASDSEKYALSQALNVCLQENIKILVVHTDSSGLSSKLSSFLEAKHFQNNDYQVFLNTTKFLNNKIFHLADKFDEIFIEYIPREFNKYADFYSRSTGLLLKDYAQNHYNQTEPLNIKVYSKQQELIISNVPTIKQKSNPHPKITPLTKPITKSRVNSLPSYKKNTYIKKISQPAQNIISYPGKQTNCAILISPLSKFEHFYENREARILNIDVQEHPDNLTVRFFYGDHEIKNHKEFKTLRISKNGQHIYLPLLFIIYNLMTESSYLDLKEPFSEEDKYSSFVYSHEMWSSFNIDKSSFLKTRSFMPKHILSSLRKMFISTVTLNNSMGKHFESFSKVIIDNPNTFVLHHTTNHQQLYLSDEAISAANAASILLNAEKAKQLQIMSA